MKLALLPLIALCISCATTQPIDAKPALPEVKQQTAVAASSINDRLNIAKQYMSKGKFRTDLVVLIDYSINSAKPRLFVVDLKTNKIDSYHVAHGSGSDENNDGYADKFSNVANSKMTSLGFYKTAETYTGKHGLSLRLDGLESSNSNARARFVVMHSASYVYESNKQPGRSWGCPALALDVAPKLINLLKNGVLIYAYAK